MFKLWFCGSGVCEEELVFRLLLRVFWLLWVFRLVLCGCLVYLDVVFFVIFYVDCCIEVGILGVKRVGFVGW